MSAADRAGAEPVPALAGKAEFDPAATLGRLRIEFRRKLLGRTGAAGSNAAIPIDAGLYRRSRAFDPAAASGRLPGHPPVRGRRVTDRAM